MITAFVRSISSPPRRATTVRPPLAVAIVLVTVALVTAACSPSADGGPASEVRVPVDGGGSYVDIPADRLTAMLAAKDFVLINVHVPYEGELAQTDAFVPFDRIAESTTALPVDKAAKIVLYCRSGSMSAIAARTLVGLGYTNVYNLDGGLNAWRARGFEVLDKGG